MTTTSTFLVYREHANWAQVRIVSGVALLLLVVFGATLPYARLPLPRFDAFIPVTSAILVTGNTITAAMLFAEARVLRSTALQVLGAGYLYTGLMLVARVLTFPGAFAPHGLLGGDANTTIWLSAASLVGLPIAIVAYLRLNRVADEPLARPPSRPALGLYAIVPVFAAALLTLLAIASAPLLPPLTATLVDYAPSFYALPSALLVLISAVMIVLWLEQRTELDLWLLMALLGWLLEIGLVLLSPGRFTVGWYVGQVMSLLSSLFVIYALIVKTNTLYAHSVQQLVTERQEREHRFLMRDAIAASIAHELRQPLSVILMSSQVARKKPAGQDAEVAHLLDEIAATAIRASDIIQSTHAMFGRDASRKQPVHLEPLLRGALAIVQSGARAQDVSIELVVQGQLKPVTGNWMQIQQALLNLFQNAIDALSRVNGRNRTLTVRCTPSEGEEGLTIRVEDNGPGIASADQEIIFAPYFTTRAEGTGLGLAITRLVIEAHGGQVTVEPLSPCGAAFVIRLPYDEGARRPNSGSESV
jgi:signal transduction histidine kinase